MVGTECGGHFLYLWNQVQLQVGFPYAGVDAALRVDFVLADEHLDDCLGRTHPHIGFVQTVIHRTLEPVDVRTWRNAHMDDVASSVLE